uniref:Uncharacterized protein n=1 Tax=Ananas comosus var. bracteatus TaxID=296719 RepID=A0A6V7PLH2_ANACO|nr:unnamed protein product [Ananas comosus var. bracteatus]
MPAEGASKIGSTSTIFGIGNTQTTIDTFDIENEIQWNHDPEINDCDGENEIRCDNELTIEDEPMTNEPYIGMEFGSADELYKRPSGHDIQPLDLQTYWDVVDVTCRWKRGELVIRLECGAYEKGTEKNRSWNDFGRPIEFKAAS